MASDSPKSLESVIVNSYSEGMQALRQRMTNYPYVVHPYGNAALTTDGVQYGTTVRGTTGTSTGSSAQRIMATANIVIPGITTGETIDEIEWGLTFQGKENTSNAGTSMHYLWQAKSASAGSSFINLHTIKSFKSTSTLNWVSRTVSGYNGNTSLTNPTFSVRLLVWNGKALNGTFRVKNSSYVSIKTKRS